MSLVGDNHALIFGGHALIAIPSRLMAFSFVLRQISDALQSKNRPLNYLFGSLGLIKSHSSLVEWENISCQMSKSQDEPLRFMVLPPRRGIGYLLDQAVNNR